MTSIKFFYLGFFPILLMVFGCTNDDDADLEEPADPIGLIDTTLMVNLGAYSLEVETIGEGANTIVFEAGLGDDMEVWKMGVYDSLPSDYQLIIYNRAGYGASTSVTDSIPRDIDALAHDLSNVITQVAQNEEVVLVGHSLGSSIVRSFVNLFPDKAEAILLIDPSHEDEYDATSIQTFQDFLLDVAIPDIPETQHLRRETMELYKNWQIMTNLPNLPNIPITVLTAMKLDDDGDIYTAEEKQIWYDLHETFGEGVDDFTHGSSDEVGHRIHIDDPTMVVDAILDLID